MQNGVWEIITYFFLLKIKDEARRRDDTWPKRGPCVGGHANLKLACA